jgi:glutathione S-transferase
METPTPLEFMGAPGSPYTRKMRGLLRYRRIPHVFYQQNSKEVADRPKARPPLLPTFYLPDESGETVAVTDSTPLIRRFEAAFEGRSVLPPDPVVELLDLLLEDYADEWLTKCMFHYRWYHAADAEKAGRVLPHWAAIDVTDAQIAPIQKMIRERQVGRLGVVGSNDVTAPVIEESYRRFLRLFDAHLQTSPYLFGRRPSAADFAVMGQLTCLALFDPTPAAITLEESPRIVAWVEATEELSGRAVGDDDWIGRDAIPETLRALLGEIGRVHAPFLLANAEALEKGAEQVETEIDGRPWVQKPFPYQGKCLRWLREARADLAPDDRAAADAILAGTGCEALFEDAPASG